MDKNSTEKRTQQETITLKTLEALKEIYITNISLLNLLMEELK